MQAQLNGLFPPAFKPDGRLLIRLADLPKDPPYTAPPVEIADARELQKHAASEAEFFAEHGFVLLPQPTAVRNWEVNRALPHTSDVARLYLAEVEAMIRQRLLPGRRIEIQQSPFLVRRGRGTDVPYGAGVHQDFDLTPDDFQENVAAFGSPEFAGIWRARYERDDVEGAMMIDFWRPTGMAGPLKHMPLAICDPNSVGLDDLVHTGVLDLAPSGRPTRQLALRHNPAQRWYFYPDMTGDEVLAFKLFEYSKRNAAPSLRTCFHSAFEHPDTLPDAERRQSCEHRVNVFLLKD